MRGVKKTIMLIQSSKKFFESVPKLFSDSFDINSLLLFRSI